MSANLKPSFVWCYCRLLVLMGVFWCSVVFHCQATEQKIEILSVYEGLANPEMYAVATDKEGFLWFGAVDGVKRYDGYGFTSFSHNDSDPSSLSKDSVGAMLYDSKQRLWIGTWGGGLDLYQRNSQSFKHYRHSATDPLSLGADKVQSLYESASGELWVGTNGGGLNLLDEQTGTFKRFIHHPKDPNSVGSNRIWSIAEDSQGHIWVATSDGLFKMSKDRQSFQQFAVTEQGLDHPEVRSILIDKDDNLWLSTRKSFGHFNPVENRYQHLSLPQGELPSVNSMTVRGDRLILATLAGIYYFDLFSKSFKPAALNGDWALLANRDVRKVLIDSSGLLWAATRYSGVIKVFPKKLAFKGWSGYLQQHSLSGLFSQVTSIIVKPGGGLYLGTGKGLVAFDGIDHFEQVHGDGLPGHLNRFRVRSMDYTADGSLYIATDRGLYLMAAGQQTIHKVPLDWLGKSSYSLEWLTVDQQDHLWFSFTTAHEVFRWDPKTQQVERYLTDIEAEFMFVDWQGDIWIGTADSGLFRLSPDGQNSQQFLPVKDKPSISNRAINAVIQSDEDTLWVATDSGVDRLTKSTGKFTNYNHIADGEGIVVKSMVMDRAGMLWLASSHGLFRLNPSNGDYHHFTTNDGLNSNSFLVRSVVIGDDGQIFMGSVDGITGFQPSQVSVNDVPPPLVITSVKVDGRALPFPLPEVLQLPWDFKNLTISYAALDFQAAQDNRYRTRLVGYEDNWSHKTANHISTFARLQPGDYRFDVKGSNNHGVWDPTGQSLQIRVSPAWYQTPLFLLIAPIVLILSLSCWLFWRSRKQQLREQYLAEQVELRTQDVLVLGDVGKVIAASFELDVIAQKIYQHLLAHLSFDTFAIGLLAANQVDFFFGMSKGKPLTGFYVSLDESNSPTQWCVSHRQSFVAGNELQWQSYRMSADQLVNGVNTKTVICEPLIAGDSLLGVLTLQSDQGDAFSSGQLNILRIVASHTAVAISHCLAFKQLSETRQRFELAIKGANAGSWEVDLASGLLTTNDIWWAMLGYEPSQMKLMPTFESVAPLVHPDDLLTKNDAFREYLKGNSDAYRVAMRMKARDGQWKWILSIGKAVRDKDSGRAVKLFGIHLDISESKAMETALQEAKDKAEMATQAKSDFLSNMSHEIRTPMNAIIGMSHLALQTDLDRRQRNYIDKVHRSGEILLGIINDILDFSKIEAGKMDIEYIEFHLEDVLDNVLNLVGLKIEEKAIELLFDIDQDVPMALIGDPLRLGQIFTNLTNNALKFTKQGGLILVSVQNLRQANGMVELQFSVKDSGIGLTEQQQAKLFHSFSQADSSTTRKYGGSGLGLAICKTLTELMAGKIWVESEADVGSTFHFTAQLGIQTAVQSAAQARMAQHRVELAAMRVLVIDDNETAREIHCGMLLDAGLRPEQVSSGPAGLTLLAQADSDDPFQLVLLDWKMPQMDGAETARQIREVVKLSHTPDIIMMTSYCCEEVRQVTHSLAINEYLMKPITRSRLLDAMLTVMGVSNLPPVVQRHCGGVRSSAIDKLRGAKVLLVEDNEINQELGLLLLNSNGMIASLAVNGQDALDQLSQHAFDGVLMDCQMPIMDGYDATRAIRRQPAFAQLPIIAMTANAKVQDIDKVLAAGMNDHIAKPIEVGSMFATMAKWIKPAQPFAAPLKQHDEQHYQHHDIDEPAAVDLAEFAKFAAIPGIDAQIGMKTTLHNGQLYRRLLRRFAEANQDLAQTINQAIVAENQPLLVQMAHNLKSTGGSIGATEVYDAAKALEQACDDPGQALDGSGQRLVDAVAIVVAGIQGLAEDDAPNEVVEAVEMTADQVGALLDKLIALTMAYNTDAVDVIEQLAPILAGTEHEQLLAKVSHYINNYEFEDASLLLSELRQLLDVGAIT